jgi:hypothetical protein
LREECHPPLLRCRATWRMPNFALGVLRDGDPIHLQCDRSLREQPAVDRCAGFTWDHIAMR